MQRDAYEPLTKAATPITFFGHTHIQGGFSVSGDGQWVTIRPMYKVKDKHEKFALPLVAWTKYLINPGSIGQPRDGDPSAAYVLYDSDASLVTYYRVAYDVGGAQKAIRQAGLPAVLADRLSVGR